MTKWDCGAREEGREHEYNAESITMYRGEDSGPDFSDEEIEYKDVKVRYTGHFNIIDFVLVLQ